MPVPPEQPPIRAGVRHFASRSRPAARSPAPSQSCRPIPRPAATRTSGPPASSVRRTKTGSILPPGPAAWKAIPHRSESSVSSGGWRVRAAQRAPKYKARVKCGPPGIDRRPQLIDPQVIALLPARSRDPAMEEQISRAIVEDRKTRRARAKTFRLPPVVIPDLFCPGNFIRYLPPEVTRLPARVLWTIKQNSCRHLTASAAAETRDFMQRRHRTRTIRMHKNQQTFLPRRPLHGARARPPPGNRAHRARRLIEIEQ